MRFNFKINASILKLDKYVKNIIAWLKEECFCLIGCYQL